MTDYEDKFCPTEYWPFSYHDITGDYPGPRVWFNTVDFMDEEFPAEKRDSIFKAVIDDFVRLGGDNIFIMISKRLLPLRRYIEERYDGSVNWKDIWLGKTGDFDTWPTVYTPTPTPYRLSRVDKLLARVGGEWDKGDVNYVWFVGQIGWMSRDTKEGRAEAREKISSMKREIISKREGPTLGKYDPTGEPGQFLKGWVYNEKTGRLMRNKEGKVLRGYKEFPFSLAPYDFLDEVMHGINEKSCPNEYAKKPHKLGIYSIKGDG